MHLPRNDHLNLLMLAMAVPAMLVFVGCTSAESNPAADAPTTSESITVAPQQTEQRLPRLWRHEPSANAAELTAAVGGVLAYDSELDCFLLKASGRLHPVVWPAGTTSIEGPAVRLASGEIVRLGDSVWGGGGGPTVGVFDIPQGCMSDTRTAIVFNANEKLSVIDEDTSG